MRSISKTSISYGLHNIPVKVCTVLRDAGTGLSNACPHCEGDVGHKNICKGCNQEVAFAEIRKAIKIGDEKRILTREQVESLKTLEISVDVVGTVSKDSLDLRLVQGSYYLLPDKKLKAWKIVQDALNVSDKLIVVKYALRGRTRLGVLTGRADSILMLDIAFRENLVEVDEQIVAPVTDFEKEQGVKFVESLKTVDLSTIIDEYPQKLEILATGVEITAPQLKQEDDELAMFAV